MATGTGTVINLSYNGEGFYMNMATPLADVSYSVTTLVAGGFSVIKSHSTTTEPVVTNGGGSSTKVYGSTWQPSVDMYIYVYTLNGTDIFYYWLTDLGNIALSGKEVIASEDTGATISLDNKVGAFYNMTTASTDVTFTTSNVAVGGYAVVKSASTTTEPVVTGATKLLGATWVVSTDMYLNIYSLDGTNVFYYWTDAVGSFEQTDRLEEDDTVTTAKDIDWAAYEVFDYTLTGATTLSDINLPTGGSKTITIRARGVGFALTLPTAWSTTFISGSYDNTVENLIVVQYVKSSTPYFIVQISQPV